MVNGKSSSNIGPLQDDNGNIIAESNDEIAECLQNHFNKPLRKNTKLYNNNHIKFHNYVSKLLLWILKVLMIQFGWMVFFINVLNNLN